MARVLVTGAAGFLGSAVCRAAVARGDEVSGLVRPGELTDAVPGVLYCDADWNDARVIADAISNANAQNIVHCAGVTPRHGADIAAAYDANVRLVWELLSAAATAHTNPGVVVVSSAAVYGRTAAVPVTEESPLAPSTHYGWSKLLAEGTARAFAATENLRVCVARPFNMIGVGEPLGSVVSDVIAQLTADPHRETVYLREVEAVRDFIDVDDAARALLLLATEGVSGEAYNICSGTGTSIADLVDAILKVWGSSATLEVGDPAATATTSIGSCEKLEALGWHRLADVGSSIGRIRDTLSGL